jgi:hypothetical protein
MPRSGARFTRRQRRVGRREPGLGCESNHRLVVALRRRSCRRSPEPGVPRQRPRARFRVLARARYERSAVCVRIRRCLLERFVRHGRRVFRYGVDFRESGWATLHAAAELAFTRVPYERDPLLADGQHLHRGRSHVRLPAGGHVPVSGQSLRRGGPAAQMGLRPGVGVPRRATSTWLRVQRRTGVHVRELRVLRGLWRWGLAAPAVPLPVRAGRGSGHDLRQGAPRTRVTQRMHISAIGCRSLLSSRGRRPGPGVIGSGAGWEAGGHRLRVERAPVRDRPGKGQRLERPLHGIPFRNDDRAGRHRQLDEANRAHVERRPERARQPVDPLDAGALDCTVRRTARLRDEELGPEVARFPLDRTRVVVARLLGRGALV